jgi:hypothetical protein
MWAAEIVGKKIILIHTVIRLKGAGLAQAV